MLKSVIKKLDLFRRLLRLPATLPQLSLILIGYLSSGGQNPWELFKAIFTLGPLIYGGIYIMNDLFDFELDRCHLEKYKRPLAAGQLSTKQALILSLFLVSSGLFLAASLSRIFLLVSVIILINNFSYSVFPRFKDIPYLDMVSNSANYSLRYFAGSSLAVLSKATIFCSLAIFLAMLSNFLCLWLREFKTGGVKSRIVFKEMNFRRIKYYFALIQIAFIFFLLLMFYAFSPPATLFFSYLIISVIFFLVKFILADSGVAFDHMVNPFWSLKNGKLYLLVTLLYYVEFILLLGFFTTCNYNSCFRFQPSKLL